MLALQGGFAAKTSARLLKSNFIRVLSTASQTTSTFANQANLPRLPVPNLDHTLELYLDGLQPVLEKNVYDDAVRVCEEFKKGEGKDLQQKLIEYDKTQKYNWLEEIWLKGAYLLWRDPLMLGSTWWAELAADPRFRQTSTAPKGSFTDVQIRRAATLVSGMCQVHSLIAQEQLEPETMKGTPLCMNQFNFVFGTTRIPGDQVDEIQKVDGGRHVLVMIGNGVWKMDVIGEDGRILGVDGIESQIRRVIDQNAQLQDDQRMPPIQMLTSSNRTTWATFHNALPQAFRSTVQSALFTLCLDDHAIDSQDESETFHQWHHNEGKNRWWDSALNIIVANSGRAGVAGEHTPTDAPAPGRVIAEALLRSAKEVKNPYEGELPQPEYLKFPVNDALVQAISKATQSSANLSTRITGMVHKTSTLTTEFIKSAGRVSPDTYFQMVMQLAWRLDQGNACSTYETGQLRAFRHGRTDTIRSCNRASDAWVKAMLDSNQGKEERWAKFQAGANRHREWISLTSAGRGCDRHLLGLRAMSQIYTPSELASSPFFNHAAFKEAFNFRLSSSNMSPGTLFWGGFAPVVNDGVGVNYALGKDWTRFSVSAWRDGGMDAKRMTDNMERSLDLVREMLE